MTTTPHNDVLLAALAAHGLDTIADDHTGTSLVDAWNATFAILDRCEPADPIELTYAALNHPNIGRHRAGPFLVWFDDRLPPWENNENGQWLDAEHHPAGFDDEHLRLTAHFHTRNGGGNRECYCSGDYSEHEDDCLAPIIEALTTHPAYLYDADDEDDSTYADFYFTIEPTQDIRDAVLSSTFRHKRAAAQNLLHQIESGTYGPWQVLAVNPNIAAAHEDAQTAAKRSPENLGRLNSGEPRMFGSNANQVLADLNAAVAYLDGSSGDVPRHDKDSWTYCHLGTRLEWLTKTYAYLADHATYARTLADMESGALPQHVMKVLADKDVAGRVKHLAHQVESYDKQAAKELAAALSDRDAVAAWIAARDAQNTARERVTELAWALHWPGDLETCPPAPAPRKADWPF